jgi:hypothetical protein
MEQGKRKQADSEPMTLRFLAVQFRSHRDGTASDFLPPRTASANEMEATHSLV